MKLVGNKTQRKNEKHVNFIIPEEEKEGRVESIFPPIKGAKILNAEDKLDLIRTSEDLFVESKKKASRQKEWQQEESSNQDNGNYTKFPSIKNTFKEGKEDGDDDSFVEEFKDGNRDKPSPSFKSSAYHQFSCNQNSNSK